MQTQRGLAPVIWVIVVALALGGGLFAVLLPRILHPVDDDRGQFEFIVAEETKNWNTYRNEKYGFEFKYPSDWKQTTIFLTLGGYANAVAFVSSTREAHLKKALLPDSDIGAVVLQGSALFVRPIADMDLIASLERNRPLLVTSERLVKGKSVLYVLHSEKTVPNKFGGGSTEVYVFQNEGFVIEANYSVAEPTGELKSTLEQVLSTFRFTK